ncbi:hypothetical protein D6827_02040 [Candidatus Parcubacteria bacterium]|nr:MAG: hypothetical protein D6827_02040 [Candidatus Parcubacteria bacterium]
MTKTKELPVGEISSGTFDPVDVAERLFDYAREFLTREQAFALGYVAGGGGSLEEVFDVIDELQQYGPPYCWIGAHEGDGALLGVWPIMEAVGNDVRTGELPSSDEPPERLAPGELHLQVNDHGNATLWRGADEGNEIVWEIV